MSTQVVPSTSLVAPDIPKQVFVNLRRFNLIMGVFHLIQGIAMIALSSSFAISLSTLYLRAIVGDGTFSLEQNLQPAGDIPFGPAVALFLLMSAVAHFLLGTVLYEWYVKNLKRNMNPARWIEYALSSSLMIVLIGMLVGIYDVSTLILMFGLNAMMNLFGLMMELHNQTTPKTDWTAFIFGCIAGIIPWIVIALYIAGAAQSVNTEIPGFVYAILITLFIFFNIFALNMWLQYRGIGPWKHYLFGERAYIILSLVAKSALAWQIWAGQLQPN